ncbi:MAG: hypothetical protein ABSA47_02760 [Verrucomicrobiota bacterium]|jgi:hypothetical protein
MSTIELKDIADHQAFLDEFARETDRAAVVLGAAKLDLQLYHLLQKVLLPNPCGTDELLDGDAPLGTFSSRINLCYRLGLIDGVLARALHLIRKIRNSFAHEISGNDLGLGGHRDRVKELIAPLCGVEGFNENKKIYVDRWKLKEGARLDFRLALAHVGARLEGLQFLVGKCYLDEPLGVIPEAWTEKVPSPAPP